MKLSILPNSSRQKV